MDIVPGNPVREAAISLGLLIYVLLVVYSARPLYHVMRSKGLPDRVAVYFNRKYIHVLAGGVVALLVPSFFSSPLLPLVLALLLAVNVYIPHRRGKLMYWFQVEDNMYEVNFCAAWGISIFILWIILGDPRLAVLPSLFIAFGDAVTGVVRNAVFRRRVKHWLGNIAMAAVTIPLGYIYGGALGAFAGAVATFVERYEFPPIDDNALIVITSSLILLLRGAF